MGHRIMMKGAIEQDDVIKYVMRVPKEDDEGAIGT